MTEKSLMLYRMIKTVLVGLVLVIPLAFGPLLQSPETTGQQLDDGKARALSSDAGLLGMDAHDFVDAAKAERVATAFEEAERISESIPAGAECTEGFAGPYPCENVDLASVVPLAELGGAAGNDSWGWTDPETGAEIALVGTGTGTTFVDVTDAGSPAVLGQVKTESTGSGIVWRDVKVDQDHAFIVSENGGHGMQVFDLTRLRDLGADPSRTFEPDALYSEFGSSHNIAINTDTHYAYAVGTDTCNGGLHMIDISTPLEPAFAGCFEEDGYTHDVQCVLYSGPDEDYQGRELCFASNTDTVTIVDVTDKANPQMLHRIRYQTSGYTHQGWLTPDQSWFIFNDELDEQQGKVQNTTTYMVDVSELDQPFGFDATKAYSHDTVSTDHNLYITDDGLIWQANYNAGLRILRYTEEGLAAGELEPIGFFDVDPGVDYEHYGDSWNVYPFFESGTIIVSNIGQGLLVLQPDYEALHGTN